MTLTLLTKQKINLIILFIFILFSNNGFAQKVIKSYIDSAFKHNIVIQQKNNSISQAQYALKQAKSYFLPNINFIAAYQTADGGRNIPLPLGDLLNPIYSTLNQLTSNSKFPSMQNQSINFFPKNFHDAKIRTTIPILNTTLNTQKEISTQQVALKEIDLKIYQRDLVKDVKTAYYNYISALEVLKIYNSSLLVANEALRYNQKLLENGKGLHAYVLRSENEVHKINSQIEEAKAKIKNAKMYFNFLLNRNEESEIITELSSDFSIKISQNENKEELRATQIIENIQNNIESMNSKFAYPKLSAFLDLGTQSEGFKFNTNTRYYLLGLQLEIPIFSGLKNNYLIKESKLNLQNAKLNTSLINNQLQLKQKVAQNDVISSQQIYQASLKQIETAASYQRLIEKGFQAGTNSFIETIDARNQLTIAKLNANLNLLKVQIAIAELERENASYPIP